MLRELDFVKECWGGKFRQKIFFSPKGDVTNDTDVGKDAVWVSLMDNDAITVIDTKDGLIHYDKETTDPVFVLLNRSDSVKNVKNPQRFVDALEYVEGLKAEKYNVRGNQRTVKYEEGAVGANYSTTGVAANRGGRGLYRKDVKSESVEKQIKNMMNTICYKCENYIDPKVKKALRYVLDTLNLDLSKVKKLSEQEHNGECDKEEGEVDPTAERRVQSVYFPSMATGRNACLEIHTDDDAFFSVVVIYRKGDMRTGKVKRKKRKGDRKQKVDTYSYIHEDSEVLKYFTFETGITVALRTGDILMFNPQIKHCVSSNTDTCKGDDVYCTSFYFKSMVMGLNDNSAKFKHKEA